MPIELAHFHLRPWFAVFDRNPAKRNVLPQTRGTHGAGDLAHLAAADMHTIAIHADLLAGQLQSDKLAVGAGFASNQRRFSDKIVFFGFLTAR